MKGGALQTPPQLFLFLILPQRSAEVTLQTGGNSCLGQRGVGGIDRQHPPGGGTDGRQQHQHWCPSAWSLTHTFGSTCQQSNTVVGAEWIWISPSCPCTESLSQARQRRVVPPPRHSSLTTLLWQRAPEGSVIPAHGAAPAAFLMTDGGSEHCKIRGTCQDPGGVEGAGGGGFHLLTRG